jgi:xanthine dehydrogenase YagS FAD-binding subunit
MKRFEHVNAGSVAQALELLGNDWATRIVAGGTDLLHEMKKGIEAPERLVNIKTIPGLDRIEESDGAIVIGALATMDDLEHDELIRTKAPLLAQAAGEAASPQLRNMATVVGNMLQRPRCWYYRDAGTHCLRKGGERCFAVSGDNRFHAIFGGGPCHIVCPSDLAPALQALWAVVVIAGVNGERRVPLAEFFRTPKQDPHRENALEPGELVTEIRVPIPQAGGRGVFLKARERRVWDFALASVAAQVRFDDEGKVGAADVVLGGVAPNPWPSREAADMILGERLSEELCARAADAAVAMARPMRDNGYKADLTRGLIKRALGSLAG